MNACAGESVTLFTPDKHQFRMHPDITLEDTQLPLERSPKILGVILDPSISFHNHCNYVSDRINKRNNMLKALAGSSWGQDKETLLMTYNALGKSIANYAAPVWSTNASDSSFKKIQTAQNAALRTATGSHKTPISDKEQRLNRRQRCTISQLRSGHCHLLQDYKHRVFG